MVKEYVDKLCAIELRVRIKSTMLKTRRYGLMAHHMMDYAAYELSFWPINARSCQWLLLTLETSGRG